MREHRDRSTPNNMGGTKLLARHNIIDNRWVEFYRRPEQQRTVGTGEKSVQLEQMYDMILSADGWPFCDNFTLPVEALQLYL